MERWARAWPLLCVIAWGGCGPRLPDLANQTGVVELPAGTIQLHHEWRIPAGAHNLEIRGSGAGSVLEAAPDFDGRALIYADGVRDLKLTNFRLLGTRARNSKTAGLPANDTPFARFYRDNGIVVEHAAKLTIAGVELQEIPNYPVLVSASSGVRIDNVRVEDSGSLGANGKNNASGGILLEEGTRDFVVRNCTLRRVRGNGIWTHSFYHSPRNASGTIEGNFIEDVARDAIQIGHATGVQVKNNSGKRIGYPPELVDIASWAVPAAIDTAGNVDHTVYAANRFEDIDGKCMDLDGFHDGEIRDNSCISRGSYDAYPWAQFGIVFNNANPDFEPGNVTLTGNVIDGAGYGGLYLMGSHQTVTGNRFVGLNRNHCANDRTRPRCDYSSGDPALLRAGIYLVPGAARPARTEGNEIRDNVVSGFGMGENCVVAAPGVSLAANQVGANRCTDR